MNTSTLERAALTRLPSDVRDNLSTDQQAAIAKAYGAGWQAHPLNIRLSLPWGGGRVFLALVGGTEQRGLERRKVERQRHPLRTVGNLFFAVGLGTVFYMAAVVALALQSSIIEF